MNRRLILAYVFVLVAVGAASAQRRNPYQRGFLLDIATAEHIDTTRTDYYQIPAVPSIGYPGASIPITSGVKGTTYDVVVRIGDIVYRARTWGLPNDLVINDSVDVRFATEKVGKTNVEVLYILRPNAAKYKPKEKEYRTEIMSRVRVTDVPPASTAASNVPAAPPVPPPPAPAPVPLTTAPAVAATTSAAASNAAALRDACAQKRDGASCTLLGEMYFEGIGVPKDELRGASLLKQGCEAGHPRGCAGMALLYISGEGISKDPVKAVEFATRACDAKEMMGCAVLGSAYAEGSGVERGLVRAAILYKQACDGDVVLACVLLGTMYDNGTGLPRDYTGAAMLYRQACDGGAMEGCDSLGRLYELGNGVPTNPARAIELYEQACKGGEAPACAHRDALKQPAARQPKP